jgi:peptide-methionine (S)-S-oxide reductase
MGCADSKPTDAAVPAATALAADIETRTAEPASGAENPVKKVPQAEAASEEKKTDSGVAEISRAAFGAGCYWGTEKYFRHDFGKKNTVLGEILDGNVGFMGPADSPDNPNYKEVCGGYTGHVEVYEFGYSGGPAYFEALVRFFFQFHDPTTLKRQGNDVGTQYASVIYCSDEGQVVIAEKVKAELQVLLDENKITCYDGAKVKGHIYKVLKSYCIVIVSYIHLYSPYILSLLPGHDRHPPGH